MSNTTPELLQSLEQIRKPTLTTREAAYFLNRAPATLHYWASKGEGLIQPVRIGKRLAWRLEDIRKALAAAA
jgi:hypothetical protein